MADATAWLRSNRLTSPPGNWRALHKGIDLVKLPSEAVGSEREDSRAAATLVFLGRLSRGFRQNGSLGCKKCRLKA
jgi:hypothetical protein